MQTPEEIEKAKNKETKEEAKPAFVLKPIEVRFKAELSEIMLSLMTGSISTQQAKLQLHNWFKALSQEDKLTLYRNDTGLVIARRISNYGLSLQQEIPVLMSQVDLGGL